MSTPIEIDTESFVTSHLRPIMTPAKRNAIIAVIPVAGVAMIVADYAEPHDRAYPIRDVFYDRKFIGPDGDPWGRLTPTQRISECILTMQRFCVPGEFDGVEQEEWINGDMHIALAVEQQCWFDYSAWDDTDSGWHKFDQKWADEIRHILGTGDRQYVGCDDRKQ